MDRTSAVDNHTIEASIGLSIADRGFLDLFLVSAWPATAEGVVALASKGGLVLPATNGLADRSEAGLAMSVAPGKWLVEGSGRSHFKLDAEAGTVSDLSHARSSFSISGSVASSLVQKISPVDLFLERYGPGRAWQGGNAHSIGHTIYRPAQDEFFVYVERSYALDFLHGLEQEAMEFRAAE